MKIHAVENGNIAIYPTNFDSNNPKSRAWFDIEVKPSEQFSSQITISNKTDRERKINLYGVDATTTSDGTFSLKQKNEAGMQRKEALAQEETYDPSKPELKPW